VVTGSDSSACSSFRVFGVLHCSSGKSSDRVQLDNCVDRLHAFESGRVDAFELTIPPLPATICGLTISVDNVDASSAWDLQQIIVTDISRNSSHTFPNSKPLGIHHSNELLGHRKTKSLLVEGDRRASYYDFSASQPGSTAVSKTLRQFPTCTPSRITRVSFGLRPQSSSSAAAAAPLNTVGSGCSLFSGDAALFSSPAPTWSQRQHRSTGLFKRSRWISCLELSPPCPRSHGHTTPSPSPFKYTLGWTHDLERANSASASRLQWQAEVHRAPNQLKRLSIYKCSSGFWPSRAL